MEESSEQVELPKLEFSAYITSNIERIKTLILDLHAIADGSEGPYKIIAEAWELERRVGLLVEAINIERQHYHEYCDSLIHPSDRIPF